MNDADKKERAVSDNPYEPASREAGIWGDGYEAGCRFAQAHPLRHAVTVTLDGERIGEALSNFVPPRR